eukprot:COSAG06_NODE_8457_length_2168_cov_25.091832_3_plen_117_part_00
MFVRLLRRWLHARQCHHRVQNFCLPWCRQQEQWGISTLTEVFEEASPLVQERLGMLVYGTLGHFSGALSAETLATGAEPLPANTGLGNLVTALPGGIVGEDARIHPLDRVSRDKTV